MDFMNNFEKHKQAILETWDGEHSAKKHVSDMLDSLKNADPTELQGMMESENFQSHYILFLATMHKIKPHKDKLHKLDFSIF